MVDTIGERLALLTTAGETTIPEIGRLAGMARGFLGKIRSGKKPLTEKSARRIAGVVDHVRVDGCAAWLIFGPETARPPGGEEIKRSVARARLMAQAEKVGRRPTQEERRA